LEGGLPPDYLGLDGWKDRLTLSYLRLLLPKSNEPGAGLVGSSTTSIGSSLS